FDPPKTNFIISLSTLILTQHYIRFNNKVFKQIKGTAMGSNFVVVYACLFLCHMESQSSLLHNPNLSYFKRFIDDAFGVWTSPLESLTFTLNTYAGPLHEHIKITPCISTNQATILDIHFFKGPDFIAHGILDSKCYQKPLNSFHYI
ncbi:hypothetical protein DD594_26760, partial [Enterobacter cloacae complex sp. 4DZ1-17B1]